MKIGIFGTGAYGMALSNILIDNECDVTMWTKFIDEKEKLEKTRKNSQLIPNYSISEKIILTNSIEECIKGKDLLIIAIPSRFVDGLCQDMKPFIKNNNILIVSKGIEQETNLVMSEVVTKYLDTKNIGVLSGPTFAVDIPSRFPIALTLASDSNNFCDIVKKSFSNNYMRIETINDIIGTEICGSIKNVFAITLGILTGLKYNESTKAFFFTEAIKSMQLLIDKLGGNKETVLSYAGVGDLLLTCNSIKSRNFSFGKLLGEQENFDIEKYLKENTVEGVYTLKSIYEMTLKNNIDLPIINTIYRIVYNDKSVNELVKYLENN